MNGLSLMSMIAVGIVVGAIFAAITGRDKAKATCTTLDVHWIIFGMFPVLFYLTGGKMKFLSASLSEFALMGEMLVLFGISYFLCIKVIGPWLIKSLGLPEEEAKKMLVGFVVLAVCTNTGHGHMLLMTVTNDTKITGLSFYGFYPGYLWVVFLPQFLSETKLGGNKAMNSLKGFWVPKVLLNPISYSCIIGLLSQITIWLPIGYMAILGFRIWWVRGQEKPPHEDRVLPWLIAFFY